MCLSRARSAFDLSSQTWCTESSKVRTQPRCVTGCPQAKPSSRLQQMENYTMALILRLVVANARQYGLICDNAAKTPTAAALLWSPNCEPRQRQQRHNRVLAASLKSDSRTLPLNLSPRTRRTSSLQSVASHTTLTCRNQLLMRKEVFRLQQYRCHRSETDQRPSLVHCAAALEELCRVCGLEMDTQVFDTVRMFFCVCGI